MTDINAADANAYHAAAPEAEFRDYVALLKPRVMSLVVFTAFVGLWIAPVAVNPFVAFCAVLFIALGGGASGALNMWYDRDIDAVMRMGASHPMGPLELADLIGLDTVLSIMEAMHHAFGDDKYRPAPLLRQMVGGGQLGRKSGQGFYQY